MLTKSQYTIIISLGAVAAIGTLYISTQNRYEPAYVVMNVALSALIWMGIGAAIGWAVDRARGAKSQPFRAPAKSESSAPASPVAASRPNSQPTDTTTLADSLRQLKTLHDEGLLTDGEYEAKRKVLAAML